MKGPKDILELLARFKASCEKHLAEFLEDIKNNRITGWNLNFGDLGVVDVDFRISEFNGEPQYALCCLIEEGEDPSFDAQLAARIAPDWDGYVVFVKTEW